MFGVDLQVRGTAKALRKLNKIGKRAPFAMRRSLAAGGGVFKKAAKPASPKETGLLSRAWRVKGVKVRRGVAYRVQVKSMKTAIRKTKKGQLRAMSAKKQADAVASKQKVKYRNPARYAHLVELGTKKLSARHFLKSMFKAKESAAHAAIRARARKEIERAAK